MVFPGKHSTGCLRCRSRKVKCDETKPACKRCALYGRPCTGYADPFVFRSQNGKLSRQALKAQGARSKMSRSLSPMKIAKGRPKDGVTPELRPAVLQERAVSIPPALTPSREQTSLAYFMTRFVSLGPKDSFPGHLSFLFDLYSPHDRGSLELATLSAAQMAAFNRFGIPDLLHQSYKNQSAAIRMLYESLRSEGDNISDKTMGTVLLLCVFADLTDERPDRPNIHTSGLYYLLEKRGIHQLGSKIGLEMYMLGLMRLHIDSFITNKSHFSNPAGCVELLSKINPFWRATSLSCQTLRLRRGLIEDIWSLSGLSQPADDAETLPGRNGYPQVMELINSCVQTIAEFERWDQDFKADMDIDSGTACTIILFRGSCIMLSSSLLAYCRKLEELGIVPQDGTEDPFWPASLISNIEGRICRFIADALSAVPIALRDLDDAGSPVAMPHDGAAGLTILYPMFLITVCPYSSSCQKQESRMILERIKSSMGVKSALPPLGLFIDEEVISGHREYDIMTP